MIRHMVAQEIWEHNEQVRYVTLFDHDDGLSFYPEHEFTEAVLEKDIFNRRFHPNKYVVVTLEFTDARQANILKVN
jgi:hypothetical protein